MADAEEVEAVEYQNEAGQSPFGKWLAGLDSKAFIKVVAAVERIKLGNFVDDKPVGEGVSERRINFGPGYRVYFGRDGRKLVILLGGGVKRRQPSDIESARKAWGDYKQRKKQANGAH